MTETEPTVTPQPEPQTTVSSETVQPTTVVTPQPELPPLPQLPVTPPQLSYPSLTAVYGILGFIIVLLIGGWFIVARQLKTETPKAEVTQPVETPVVQQAALPVVPSVPPPTPAIVLLPQTEATVFDKNTLCDRECKKIGYTFGAQGPNACHCLRE